jgi:hypothetical protein
MRSVDPIAMGFEYDACIVQCLCWPSKIPRRKCNFGFGHDAPSTSHRFLSAECARGPAQQRFRANEIPELRHRDAAHCKRRRVIAERNAFQRAQRIAKCKRPRRRRD